MVAVVLGLSLNGTLAQANDAATANPGKQGAANAEGTASQAPQKSGRLKSSEIRATKSFGVFVEPVGFTMTSVNGLRGEYLLSESNVITLSVARGSFSLLGEGANTFSELNEFTKMLTEVRFKRFIGNSFYAAAGLGMENWTINYYVKKKGSDSEDVQIESTSTQMGVTIHVGNQWSWDYFSVGVDWAGYFYALSSSFSAAKSEDVESDAKEKAEVDLRKTIYGGSAHAVRVHVGTFF
jgi:hypothetical protein